MNRPRLHITLLGEFSLLNGDGTALSFSGDRPITLLAYLLLHRHTAVSRQHLAFTLWPDSSDTQARTNLRNLLHTLRNSLPEADSYIRANTMTLQWRSDADVWLDVAEFEALLSVAEESVSTTEKVSTLQAAISLYNGDLLPNNYDDWAIPLRGDLRNAFINALHQLVSLLEQEGNYRAALHVGQRLIQQDPLDETSYVLLMHLYALIGDRAGVRRVFEACVVALQHDLGIEPAPTTREVFEDFLQLDAPAISALRIPVTIPAGPLHLPVPGTTFIGRTSELKQIGELLADHECRLLTIVGPGGVGKTRLALKTADEQRRIFGANIAWVSLNSVEEPGSLATTIAETLNIRLRGSGNVETELIQHMSARELLLILDNFEHLLTAAEFVTRVLDATTAVKILVTSRQALDQPAEWRFDLGSLPIPDDQEGEEWADNSAVRLFIQSARRVASNFSATAVNYSTIIRICQLVGGMPLGLELAASWLRLLTCEEVAHEIENSLDFLTVSHGNLLPRHRSLRSVFEYSWELLEADEQQVLLRLSIFSGGFTRKAAAEAALADLAKLSRLVDYSLVHRLSDGRFNLHEVIRRYAAEKLQADLDAHSQTAQWHSVYYLGWLESQVSQLRGKTQKDALAAIAMEISNIRIAWQWSVDHGCSDLLRRASFPLFYFYEVRGLLAEGENLFRLSVESLQSADGAPDVYEPRLTIEALQLYGAYLGFRQGQISTSDPQLRRVVSELKNLPDDTLLVHGLIYLGILEWSLGQFTEAIVSLQDALSAASEQQQEWEMAMAQVYLGLVCYDQGQLAEARRRLTNVQPLAHKLCDPRLLSNLLLIFGRTNLLMGHLGDAELQLQHCLTISQETIDPNSITYATLYLGMVKLAQGDLADARQLVEQSMSLYRDFNDMVGLERSWVSMGFLEIAAQNYEAAQTHFLTFLRSNQRVHSIRFILAAVIGIATCLAYYGDEYSALLWTMSVLQHKGLDWEVRRKADALYDKLMTQLSADEIAAARKQTSDQSFEMCIAAITGSDLNPLVR